MATTTFKNYISNDIGTSNATVYTAPSGAQTTVIGMTVSNIKTLTDIDVSISLFSYSANARAYLLKSAPIPYGDAIVPVGGDQKLVLEGNDYITVSASSANAADVIISVLEII